MKLTTSLLTAILLLLCQISFGQIVNSSDGYCYAKSQAPDVFKNVTEEVLIKNASNRTLKTPADYQTVTEQIEVTPASTRFTYIPAVYETVTEEVVDKPESSRLINVPAVFETITETVLVKEESKRLVVVPATYKTVSEQIEVKPASKRFEFIPAVYETVSEQMERSAPSARFVNIPAQYETVMEDIEIEPASIRVETIEPTYRTEEEKVITRPASTKWVETRGDQNCLSADPKDCTVWCMVEVPAEYKIVTKRINVGCDGSGIANSGCTKEIKVPAKYGQKAIKKLVSPATTREEPIPAEYATVTRSVLQTPATTREIEIPAEYITITKEVVVTPATTREEIIPAKYKEVKKQRMVSSATTREEIIPATYKTISKRIVATPASTNEEIIPASYETVSKKVLVSPESVTVQEIPAEYATVTKRVLVTKGDLVWNRIVCPRSQTSEMNRDLQKALAAAGYDVGPMDNIFGPKTYAAMVKYQKDNDMLSGHLDYQTVTALNLNVLPDDENPNAQWAVANGGASNNSDVVMSSRGDSNASNSSASNSNGGESNAASGSDSNSNSESTANTMSSEELAMIDEINLMRSNPKAYAEYVKVHLQNVENDPGLSASYKADELASGKELIAELEKMDPLPLIKPHEGLHKVAVGHGDYVRSVGQIGHVGADGSYPWDRVRKETNLSDGNENLVAGGDSVRESLMILLVDSGIQGRGHRKTLFEPKWTYGGIYKIGNVGSIPNGWIQVFGSK